MRLLFLNRSFAPDVEATGQLLGELCADLSANHEVVVVAGRPNFGGATRGWWPVRVERQGAVRVYRVNNPRFNKQSMLSRGVGLLAYLWGATWTALLLSRPDVIVVETDPPFLGVLGAFLKRWHGAQLVYYLQDLFPEVGLAMGRLRPGLLTRGLRWATQIGLRSADRVIVLGEDMRQRVLVRGIAEGAISIVPNWTDVRLIKPEPPAATLRTEWELDDRFTVAYSGNLGLSQSLDALLAAAESLASEPIQFILIGDGAAKADLQKRVDERQLRNVRFLPYQPKDQLSASLGTADVHLIPMKRGLAGYLVPSKLYGILAAGRPYVAAVDEDCDVARVTREFQTGLVIPPDDVARLVDALRWCLSHGQELLAMGERGRTLAESSYDRRTSVQLFEQVLREVAGGADVAPRIEPRPGVAI